MKQHVDLAIVGGGIVGLAHAYIALKKGMRVVLFEREEFPTGASVRNFGLIWPIGQQPGRPLDLAMRSREHWLALCHEAAIWITQNGSMHVVYHDDEWHVLQEFYGKHYQNGYDISLLTSVEALSKSPFVNQRNLKGALYSSTECTVYAREAVRKVTWFLQVRYGLILRTRTLVRHINMPEIETQDEIWRTQQVLVCGGADFETLYPELFNQYHITKCKLQMMKASIPSTIQVGPTLCAGLTLRHYKSFVDCASLAALDNRYDEQDIRLKEHGIHVLVSQNQEGEIIIGDSHHYGKTLEPFDSEEVNQLILEYLRTFFVAENLTITERWHGVYSKLKEGIALVADAVPGVKVITGLGGAGMTLSFGLAEEVINSL